MLGSPGKAYSVLAQRGHVGRGRLLVLRDRDETRARRVQSMSGLDTGGVDTEALNATLQQLNTLPATERQAVLDAYKDAHNGQSLSDVVGSALGGRDDKLAQALIANDEVGADAVRLDMARHSGFLGLGTNRDQIYTVMKKYARQ